MPCSFNNVIKNGYEEDACKLAGYDWAPDATDGGTGNQQPQGQRSACFFSLVLSKSLAPNYVLQNTTYGLACNFRDKILSASSMGKQLLDTYHLNRSYLFTTFAKNPLLIKDTFDTWLLLQSFVSKMLQARNDFPIIKEQNNNERFDQDKFDKLTRLIKNYFQTSENNEFSNAVDGFINELKRYIGLSPTEALNLISLA